MKIKDLLQLEELNRVVDIDTFVDTGDKARDMVEKYIITEDMKPHFLNIAEDLNKPKHQSYQVIGNYGSGKSHMLAVLTAIIDNPELARHLQDEEVGEAFQENLDRDFAVVQFELQPGEHSLVDFFYDRIETMLERKYGIEIPPIDVSEIYDHKEKIKEILGIIKSENSRMGLLVIIDEISDFLKTKPTKEMKEADTQFMRILGQASNQLDFIFIGSMQKNVFDKPEFVESAESFGRTAQRYEMITISKEDIKKVLSHRALKKDISQRDRLEGLLSEYGEQIPQVQNKLYEFIQLFPVHPYVIDIFNQLPYFENRGILEFAVDQVKEILDEKFPVFITFDKIYDKIAKNHSIRTLDEVSPVIDAVETLESKIDLLREERQEHARRIIKALAVLKLYGKTTSNGATPEELASELMIISDNITNVDRIRMILNKLREVTDGQFINKTKNDYYFIDLEHDVDYDVVIERKANNLYDGAEDDELLKLLKKNFELQADSEHQRVFSDYSYWMDKKSFRFGSFIYDDDSGSVEKGEGDFNFVFVSPYEKQSKLNAGFDTAILNIKFDEKLDKLLRKIAAVTSLKKGSGYPRQVLNRKQKRFKTEAEELLLDILKDTGIENGGEYESTGQLFAQEPDNLSEYYYEVKPALFNRVFNDKYPEYPRLFNRLSPENIQGEVERTINEIFKGGEKIKNSNAQNLLSSLELLDEGDYLNTRDSKYEQVILQVLENNKGKNIKIEDMIEKLAEEPFGLQEELVYLIILVLTYNGEANLKQRGGRTITSSDLEEFFSSGLRKFKDVPYITLETEFPVEKIINLFKVLNLNPGLVRQKTDRPEAVRRFKDKVLDIKGTNDEIDERLERIKNKPDEFVDINKLLAKREGLKESIPLDRFLRVNTVADFQKVALEQREIKKELKPGLKLLDKLHGYVEAFEDYIYKEYSYLKGSLKFVKEHKGFFDGDDVEKLKELAENCEEVMFLDGDTLLLLNQENKRLLKGKLEQYQRKYRAIYYRQHRQLVGEDIDWGRLEEIKNNSELLRLDKLKDIIGLNTSKYRRLIIQIRELEQTKCLKLKEEHLNENFKCPFCSFPENSDRELLDINNVLDEIWNKVIDIKEEWEELILNEIENHSDNIDKLVPSEQEIIRNIRKSGELPEEIDEEMVQALNNLFSDLQEVEISPNDIEELMFKGQGVLDYEMFTERLDKIKEWVLEQGDRDNLRIKMKDIQEEIDNG